MRIFVLFYMVFVKVKSFNIVGVGRKNDLSPSTKSPSIPLFQRGKHCSPLWQRGGAGEIFGKFFGKILI